MTPRKPLRTLFKAAALAAAILAAAPLVVRAETLIVQGSTTFNRAFMEPQQAALEAATGHVLTVIPNKSMPGLIALLEGRAHLAMISAPLENEIQMLEKVMPGLPFDQLQTHEILRVRVSVAVHPSNTVRKAKIDDVKQILLGRVTNWAALGGVSKAIRIVLVGGGGGVTTAVESQFLDGITRHTVIGLARRRGLEVIERRIMPDELSGFTECFITGTAAEVTAVAEIAQWNFKPGAITQQLMDDYSAEVQPKGKAVAA